MNSGPTGRQRDVDAERTRTDLRTADLTAARERAVFEEGRRLAVLARAWNARRRGAPEGAGTRAA